MKLRQIASTLLLDRLAAPSEPGAPNRHPASAPAVSPSRLLCRCGRCRSRFRCIAPRRIPGRARASRSRSHTPRITPPMQLRPIRIIVRLGFVGSFAGINRARRRPMRHWVVPFAPCPTMQHRPRGVFQRYMMRSRRLLLRKRRLRRPVTSIAEPSRRELVCV